MFLSSLFLSFYISSCLNFASSMWFLLLLYLSLAICFSSGADTLSANRSLSGDETIISKDENFVLGFFKPGESLNYYVGIWYKKVTSNPPTVVWVANRETPVFDRFKSQLKIVDANLVLLNESNFKIWSTNVTTTTNSNSAVVVIRDDGNLVLRDGSSSAEAVWQSFDHPTDTWLPGLKLGYDYRTKKSQLLTSWKSKVNPAEGFFSMELDPSEKAYIFKWNRSKEYWTSGSWNGRVFSQIPEMRLNHVYNFSFFSNENESYFTYSVYNPSIISRFVVDVSGQVQQQIWLDSAKEWSMFSSQPWYVFWPQPKIQCEVYSFCGAFGTCSLTRLPICSCLAGFKPRSESEWNQSEFSEGCVRKTDLQCGMNLENPDFLTIKVKSLPENSFVAVGSGGECRTNCLNNCSCNAYSFVDDQCLVWDGDLFNLPEDNTNGKEIYVKVASKDLPPRKKSNRVTLSTVVGSVAGALFVSGLIMLIIYRKNRRLVGKTRLEGLLVAFEYKDLQIATKNFSDKLGGGGFGSVFKGVLRDSSVVAVKKLESMSQGEKQFRSEVSTIGTIQHVHLIRLRGFCAQGKKTKLLVYDYMPNGSLDSHLFHEKPVLSWKTRYDIALGTARGLVYLHEKCRDCIIHCDIKPENILLDADFCPKIADFGLAKLVGRDFSRVLTTIRGTRGYLAPEWLSGVAVTAKADVFSYGMLLFELVNGKRNTDGCEDLSTYFPCLAASVVMAGGDILGVLDTRLNKEANVEQVSRICKVAFWCIQDEEERRPSMSVVEQILEGVLDVKMPPVPRSVQLYVGNTEPVVFFTESSSQAPSSSSSGVSPSKSASSEPVVKLPPSGVKAIGIASIDEVSQVQSYLNNLSYNVRQNCTWPETKLISEAEGLHRFLKLNVLDLCFNYQRRNQGKVFGLPTTKTNCLNNCADNGYSFIDDQCLVWDGDLFNLLEDNTNGKEIYVKVASKDLPPRKKSNMVALSTVVGSVVGTLFVSGLIMLIIYRKKKEIGWENDVGGLLVAFEYEDLQIATKNFSDKLGGGGFGSVFKGVLRDSSVVAVKKLESMSQGEKQFRSEVNTIGTIQHVHFIRLRGLLHKETRLSYWYMITCQMLVLSWKTRYETALGTARGLVYLHEKCKDYVDFCPKIEILVWQSWLVETLVEVIRKQYQQHRSMKRQLVLTVAPSGQLVFPDDLQSHRGPPCASRVPPEMVTWLTRSNLIQTWALPMA
ncbi:hypothetical protein OSB04_021875 [Centaurea solstitialis]|uniref:G-type lectin S-receptor-like serine/threonine-protein kinase n=1 Tax=Centaurea solstitialis TaxID=347529 RepID=A0AA38W749_9ASTR|nr:hypothetical protein OSB04_021875 [Centaurea solstitialis]